PTARDDCGYRVASGERTPTQQHDHSARWRYFDGAHGHSTGQDLVSDGAHQGMSFEPHTDVVALSTDLEVTQALQTLGGVEDAWELLGLGPGQHSESPVLRIGRAFSSDREGRAAVRRSMHLRTDHCNLVVIVEPAPTAYQWVESDRPMERVALDQTVDRCV